jgi:hypothetical protein
MNGNTMRRMDGAVKVVTGLGAALAGACFLALGWWIALPVCAVAGYKISTGTLQVAFGE